MISVLPTVGNFVLGSLPKNIAPSLRPLRKISVISDGNSITFYEVFGGGGEGGLNFHENILRGSSILVFIAFILTSFF